MNSAARSTLSVLIITLNEERMLDRVLDSVRWADEIVIVDSGSSDRTEEIARRYTDGFHYQPYEGHGLQRRRSLELATGEWILYIDADEVITPELAASIQRVLEDPGDAAGFRFRLETWFLGKWFGRRGWRREWKVRLFRRDRGDFDDSPIHEGVTVHGRIGSLDGALLHYPYRDLEHFVEKMNRYSTAMAAELRSRGRTSTPAGAFAQGIIRFLRDYLAGGDFLYGGAGLIRSTVYGYYTFLKYAKLREPPGEAAPNVGIRGN